MVDDIAGGAWPNSTGLKIGAWKGFFRRGFHRSVARRETLLLVCSSVGMEVAGKSCWLQSVPIVAMASKAL